MIVLTRALSLRINCSSRACCPVSSSSPARISTLPRMLPSGLRISCAMLADSSPTAARRSASRTRSRMRCASVRSWKMAMAPVTSPAASRRWLTLRPTGTTTVSQRTMFCSPRPQCRTAGQRRR